MNAELQEVVDKGQSLDLIYRHKVVFTPRFKDSPSKLEEGYSAPRPIPKSFKKGAVKLESPLKSLGDNIEFDDDY